MQNLLHTRLLLLFLSTTLVIAGCIAFGTKKIAANKTQQPQQPDLLALAALNQTTCPKILNVIQNRQTPKFDYTFVLDTSIANCTVTTFEDVFGADKLFQIYPHHSFELSEKRTIRNYPSKVVTGEEWCYGNYYKGIKVENSGLTLTTINHKIVKATFYFYPHLNIDTTGMLSKAEAAMLVLKERNTPAEAYKRAMQYMFNHYDLKIDPSLQKIYYSFRFIVGDKPGTYLVDAISGLIYNFIPYKFTHVCYKCADDR